MRSSLGEIVGEMKDDQTPGFVPEEGKPSPSASQPGSRRWLLLLFPLILGIVPALSWWFGAARNPDGEARHAGSLPELGSVSQGLRDEAFAVAGRLVESFPNDPDAFYSKAAIHNRFGDSEEAIRCWEESLKLDPEFALSYYCLGWDAYDRGQGEESVKYLRAALRLDPTIGHAHLLLAQAFIDMGKTDEALEPLKTHLRLVPRSTEGHFRLGQVYLKQERYEDAKRFYLAALDLNPKLDVAYFGLANACDGLGDTQQANEYRETFAELREERLQLNRQARRGEFTDDTDLRQGLSFALLDTGKVYAAHGELSTALEHWTRAAEVAPQDVECRQMLVSVYQQMGRLEEALKYLEELSNLQPDTPLHQLNLGVLYSNLGQFEAAEAAFQKTRQMLPQRHEGYAGQARLYLDANRNVAEAMQLARKAVELAPVAANYYLLGVAQVKCEDREAALESFKRATELDRSNPVYAKAYSSLQEAQ